MQGPVVLEDGELDGVPGGVQPDGELRLPLAVRDANQVPAPPGLAPVPEGGHEAKLLGQALVEHPSSMENTKSVSFRLNECSPEEN